MILLIGGPGKLAEAADLEAAASQLAAGAGGLALDTLSRDPPEPDTQTWEQWARLRVRALELQGRRREVVALAGAIPDAASEAYRQWVGHRAAEAELDLGRPAEARKRLVRLIAGYPAAEALRSWLRLVYRSYAEAGHWQDAMLAVRRYRRGREKGAFEASEQVEQARIFLRGGARETALSILGESAESAEARQLRIRILGELGRRRQAYEEARIWAKEARGGEAARAWSAVAGIAARRGEERAHLQALEKVLESGRGVAHSRPVERTWEAYLQLGESLGNEAGLLVGEDRKWIERARSAGGVGRRALLASVSLLGRSREARNRARIGLVKALGAAGLERTAFRLFREGPAFQEEGALSPLLRVHLGRLALAEEHYEQALAWMAGIEALPEGVKAAPWRLTRARLRIKLGRFKAGTEDLRAILEDPGPLEDAGFREHFLQVVFDLQQADHSRAALGIFRGVYAAVKDQQARRELLFWMGECREALGDHRGAAALFLRSAAHPPGGIEDRWGRTARFQAARSLEQTDYAQDARHLYRKLLGAGSASQDMAVRRRLNRLGTGSIEQAGKP
ncbi:hypothetical protein [Thiohalorhabdus methylotrophus]|uniref:Tetratricopeptide repeat protein n=1 Tax=Thiohalorhabdus methylotrophus TaxID=3242694 RepID=A0ABV4TY74_9GAMM